MKKRVGGGRLLGTDGIVEPFGVGGDEWEKGFGDSELGCEYHVNRQRKPLTLPVVVLEFEAMWARNPRWEVKKKHRVDSSCFCPE